jgi:hypothetical protein
MKFLFIRLLNMCATAKLAAPLPRSLSREGRGRFELLSLDGGVALGQREAGERVLMKSSQY